MRLDQNRTADGFLFNMSQVCACTSRLLIQESIAPQFIEAVKARFAHAISLVGNDPSEASTSYGPLADKSQFERVMTYIEKGKKGGEPLIGGKQKGTTGFFIEPTIFVNPDKESEIFKEEIFGPVLSIRTFKTEEEAIEIANDTVTGLSSQIYTSDMVRALRVSGKIEAGSVSVNAPFFPSVQAPFGGWKDSGVGSELGKYGLQQYLQTKTININMKLPSTD